MKEFLIDTADEKYIKNMWASLNNDINNKMVMGITTNPNAFYKIGKYHMKEWVSALPRLCEIVSNIRGDNKGHVHIQCPYSNMTQSEVLKYVEYVSKFNDGNTKIALKIPPYTKILSIIKDINEIADTNVTGLSDAATALKCVTYGPKYISIIPGRMEEFGINAKEQIAFLQESNLNCKIITGSMRTIEGLKWVFQYNTLPTIGERVWNLMLESRDNLDVILNIDYNTNYGSTHFSPIISEKNIDLSTNFFKQMDDCGKIAYNDFNELTPINTI